MIRTVCIPPLTFNRIGQASTVTYQGSTCTATDPATGLCLPDVYLGDPSNPLPGDPGAGSAVAEWAAASNAATNQAVLNQSGVAQPASFAIAESLMAGNIPSPLPGLGVTVPDPLRKYLLWGAVAVALVLLSNSGGSRSRR